MQCLCSNRCLTDIVLNKHHLEHYFVKIEDISENYEIEDSDRQFQYIEKTRKIRCRFKKKLPKKYNKVIYK